MKRIVIVLAAVLIAGCGQSGSSDDSDNGPAPVAEVRTALATAGSAAVTITAYGVAEQGAANENALTTQAEARLARIVAPTGTAVGAGQIVAILNPSATSRLDVSKAMTDANAANDALARVVRLRHDGLSSDAPMSTVRGPMLKLHPRRSPPNARGTRPLCFAPRSQERFKVSPPNKAI